MNDEEKKAFNIGYVLACCNLQNLHDEPTIAWDVLSQAGIRRSEVKGMDLSEYDAVALEEICQSRPDSPLEDA